MSCWSKIKTVFYCPVQVPVVYGACLQRVHPVSLFGFSSSQGGSHDGEPFMWAFSLHTQNAAALIRKWRVPVHQTSQETVTHKVVNVLCGPNPSKQQQHISAHGHTQKIISV